MYRPFQVTLVNANKYSVAYLKIRRNWADLLARNTHTKITKSIKKVQAANDILASFFLYDRREVEDFREFCANCRTCHRSDLESVSFAAFSNPTPLMSSLCFHRLCQACRRPFNDPAVARYPNGVTTHLHCARNKNVCPVTGHVFSFVDHTTESPKDE